VNLTFIFFFQFSSNICQFYSIEFFLLTPLN